jgi:hypothetical protein
MGRGKAVKTLNLIEQSRAILAEVQPATVRAVAYRLFTRGAIASMSRNEVAKVSRILTIAREEGDIPWEWIVDETREREATPTWGDPKQFATTVTRSYRRNKWSAQPIRIEVWSEKGTVRGTLRPVLDEFEVPFRVMHGFGSATAVHDIAVETASEQPLVALYVGDFDPSGIYMSEVDLPERITRYREQEAVAGRAPNIVRIALVHGDCTPALPSFNADTKVSDPRYVWFKKKYGGTCWELDAMSPVVLRDRVRAAIVSSLDVVTWDRYVAAEALEQESIRSAVSRWGSLTAAV